MDIEYLDFIDENDLVVGKLQRQEFYEKRLKNFRTAHLFETLSLCGGDISGSTLYVIFRIK